MGTTVQQLMSLIQNYSEGLLSQVNPQHANLCCAGMLNEINIALGLDAPRGTVVMTGSPPGRGRSV